MARQVCIKTATGTYCKSSPILDCSCDGGKGFDDPFYREPEPREFATPTALLEELKRVLGVWESSQRTSGDIEKLLVLWKIAQLVLLKEIDIDDPFIITAL